MPAQHRPSTRRRPTRAQRRRMARRRLVTVLCVLAVGGTAAALLSGYHDDSARAGGVGDVGTTHPDARPTTHQPETTPRPESRTASRVETTPKASTASPSTASRALLASRVKGAAAYATDHHLRAGVAVLDIKTGQYTGGGEDDELFGTASVVKVLIAAQLLSKSGVSDARKSEIQQMIERSDDDIATMLWPKAGGPSLVKKVEQRFDVDDLGTANTRAGFWGNTHVSPSGLVHFYAALAKSGDIGQTVISAMCDYKATASDGTNQVFGFAAASSHACVKQGWASESADDPNDAVVNSTAFVDDGRYAVAILTEGDDNDGSNDGRGMNVPERKVVTHMARMLMPGGQIGTS